MAERTGVVTVLGNPVTLVGNEIKVGDTAPDATLLDGDLNPVTLSSLRGKVCVLAAVPSLDTPICDVEARRFNQEAAALGGDVQIVVVSVDLPFAQKRWCGAAGVDKVKVVSDYMAAEFGQKYGVLIKEVHLLARSIFVIDRDGTVKYTQMVSENGDEPDYEPVIEAARELM